MPNRQIQDGILIAHESLFEDEEFGLMLDMNKAYDRMTLFGGYYNKDGI